MTSLIRSLRGGARSLPVQTIDDYVDALAEMPFAGVNYPVNTLGFRPGSTEQTIVQRAEPIPQDFVGYVQSAYKSNGVIFACMLARLKTFSAIRFQYQTFRGGRPSELWGDASLQLLEQPWPGATTQDLLARLIQDADLAGNSYWTIRDGALLRLRPDWVEHLLEPIYVDGVREDDFGRPRKAQLGWRLVGYLYTEGGPRSQGEPAFLWPDNVAHFAPIPDPLATYRGMSWLSPIVRELQADQLMTKHRMKFFENGATPNLVIKHPAGATPTQVKAYRDALDAGHKGVDNAYKTLHVGGGADVTLVGANLQQIEFAVTQGHGETRIAAAAGVPPIIVGLSEGLQSATYSNYGQARRRFADGELHPLWSNVSGSLQRLVRNLPPGNRLWYDSRDVPFLREDSKDAASILETNARTIRTLVDGGYTPDSASRAVLSGDLGLLEHTGLYSVQLQRPSDGDGLTLKDRMDIAAALIRAGFEPEASLAAVGVPPIEHTGLVPVTVKPPEDPPAAADPDNPEPDPTEAS